MSTKKCPNCGNVVSDEAKFCHVCGQNIQDVYQKDSEKEKIIMDRQKEKESKGKIFTKTWFVLLMLWLCFPVGAFIMWKYKKFNIFVRILISAFFGFGFLMFVLAFISASAPCNHDWKNATCEEPKKCVICGETEGEPLKHIWNEATCVLAKECSVCGKTEGDPIGHELSDWEIVKEASCSEEGQQKGVCKTCGEELTETISKTEHIAGEWEILEEATYYTDGTRVKYCTVCGEEAEKETFDLSEEEKEEAFKNECSKCTYEEIARDPAAYMFENIKFKGEVIQVMEEGNEYILRVNVTKGRYFWEDTILVYYTKKDSSEPRILEDDIIMLYGYGIDTVTYESVMGASITIPAVMAEYIDIQ